MKIELSWEPTISLTDRDHNSLVNGGEDVDMFTELPKDKIKYPMHTWQATFESTGRIETIQKFSQLAEQHRLNAEVIE